MKSKLKTKEQLEASSQEYKEALEHDIDNLVDRTRSILSGALIIGAGFWIAYRIFKSLHGGDESKKEQTHNYQKEEPSVLSIVKQTILKELAVFLLGILKEKIIEYMQDINKDEEDS